MGSKPVVCVDLDGVLNVFDGWKGADYFHQPRPGAGQFLKELKESGYEVVVFTVRWAPHVQDWLTRYGLRQFVSEVTNQKPPAHVYIDDRAICFTGDFLSTLEQIRRFRAHWETDCEDEQT